MHLPHQPVGLVAELHRLAAIYRRSLRTDPDAMAFLVERHPLAELSKLLGRAADRLSYLESHMYTDAQIMTAQDQVITEQQAEIDSLKSAAGADHDKARDAAVANPLTAAKLAEMNKSPTPAGGDTDAAGNPTTFGSANGVVTDASGRTVYTYAGPGSVDANTWPAAGTYKGQAVYLYSGDTGPGSILGVVPNVWATIPAPPAAA